jgi:SAM-dependent methyltransferase
MNSTTSQNLSELLPTAGPSGAGQKKGDPSGLRASLGALKRRVGRGLKRTIIHAPLPLGLRHWATRRLLPLDPWERSLAYQQCLANRVIARHGATVQSGPFRGVTCITDANEGCLVPKLLGCYEDELSPTLDGFIATGCDRVIDVGCASGYYVVGLAVKMPKAQTFGFDIDQDAIARCRKLIAQNKVQDRVSLCGLCTPAELERLIKGRTLLIMDCEGAEFDLLDPRTAPALLRCDMIIECHDFVNPAISGALQERFRESHAIERIQTTARVPDSQRYPGLSALPRAHWQAALDERRLHKMEWLVMRVR